MGAIWASFVAASAAEPIASWETMYVSLSEYTMTVSTQLVEILWCVEELQYLRKALLDHDCTTA